MMRHPRGEEIKWRKKQGASRFLQRRADRKRGKAATEHPVIVPKFRAALRCLASSKELPEPVVRPAGSGIEWQRFRAGAMPVR